MLLGRTAFAAAATAPAMGASLAAHGRARNARAAAAAAIAAAVRHPARTTLWHADAKRADEGHPVVA